jgi:hypothetical protein
MSGHDELWAKVNAALDRRCDPLADEAVRAALRARPDAESDLERLARRLELLSAAAPPSPAQGTAALSRRLGGAMTLTAAAAVLLALAGLLSIGAEEPASRAEPLAGLSAPASRVLSFRATTTTTTATERTEHVRDAAGEHLFVTRPLPGGGHHLYELHQPRPRSK